MNAVTIGLFDCLQKKRAKYREISETTTASMDNSVRTSSAEYSMTLQCRAPPTLFTSRRRRLAAVPGVEAPAAPRASPAPTQSADRALREHLKRRSGRSHQARRFPCRTRIGETSRDRD